MNKIKALLVGITLCSILFVRVIEVDAAESVILPTNQHKENIISVIFPSICEQESSPLDFLIDPEQLVYQTDAAKYGGGRVDSGATLLFRNHNGDYNFSRYSDKFTITNQSNVPVVVKVTASIANIDSIEMVGNTNFGETTVTSMYMAIVDDEGHERPLQENGEVSITIEMQEAPENAYAYYIDENSGTQSYSMTSSPENIAFDVYSFGLVGYCNPNGDWASVKESPKVTLTWSFEAILPEELEEELEEEELEEKIVDEETEVKPDVVEDSEEESEINEGVESNSEIESDSNVEESTESENDNTETEREDSSSVENTTETDESTTEEQSVGINESGDSSQTEEVDQNQTTVIDESNQ